MKRCLSACTTAVRCSATGQHLNQPEANISVIYKNTDVIHILYLYCIQMFYMNLYDSCYISGMYEHELDEINVCVYRLLGKLVISLQHVVAVGQMLLREPITDSQHSLTNVSDSVKANTGDLTLHMCVIWRMMCFIV